MHRFDHSSGPWGRVARRLGPGPVCVARSPLGWGLVLGIAALMALTTLAAAPALAQPTASNGDDLPPWSETDVVGEDVAATPAAPDTTPGAFLPTLSLPPAVRAELQRVRLPEQALSLVAIELGRSGSGGQFNARAPVNPASLMKLLTTHAALDRLGPAFRWQTPVWLDGPVRDGVLEGHLHIQGRGDPKLVLEQVWLLLRRVKALGVHEIRGDIVLDRSVFEPGAAAPGEFDGEALRPYNVQADALLLNQRSTVYTFVPESAAGQARVIAVPPLADKRLDARVPLAPGRCADWRGALQADFSQGRTRFGGRFPGACGETNWAVADPDPATYDARLLRGLWQEMGGVLHGQVREGPPPDAAASFFHFSPSLPEVVRDINKFSNNPMAQQLFLTLAAQADPVRSATPTGARTVMREWLLERLGAEADTMIAGGRDALVIDNGSGLSRHTRVSALMLARLLEQAWASPVMPELMASLPVTGVDGTLRRSRAAPGRAHLKTGSLRDVQALAGYVLTEGGRRWVFVAVLHHPGAGMGRPVLDAALRWVASDLQGGG
jgi:serine-type D-Ala-D-Ala carboxypeptidase/endopeptidase (penicillin-binding protein 4)